MSKLIILLHLICFIFDCVYCSMFFHDSSYIKFAPDIFTESFGYSVGYINIDGQPSLLVGAPLAVSPLKAHNQLNNTGAIYICDIKLTSPGVDTISCKPYEIDNQGNYYVPSKSYLSYKNEMRLGTSMATFTNGHFVACAPRWANQIEEGFRQVNGMCYFRKRMMIPLIRKDKRIMILDSKRPDYGAPGLPKFNYVYGEAGISVYASRNNDFLFIGAPGVLDWTGTVIRYTVVKDGNETNLSLMSIFDPYKTKALKPFSYFGYSLEAAEFNPGDGVYGVSSAPRGFDGCGQVIIFDNKPQDDQIKIKLDLKGYQLGSYFGASLLVSDINADGRPDLLVSAPLYSSRDGNYDVGIVYVYLNYKEDSSFKLQIIDELSPTNYDGARFGTSMAEIGDLDTDGFPEIAIGAPYEDTTGIVYIYSGCKTGITLTQRLKPKELNHKAFGHSLTSGFDVDNNGCNDLGIGGLSGPVTLWRSMPQAHIGLKISVPNNKIDENEDVFNAVFSIEATIPQNSKITMNVSLQATSSVGNLIILEPKDFTIEINTTHVYLFEIKIQIVDDAVLSKPIELMMQISQDAPSNVFCSSCGVISRHSVREIRELVQLTKVCGTDLVCTPDFKVALYGVESHFIPGVARHINVKVLLTNDGEVAHTGCVKIILPTSPIQVPADCNLPSNLLMICTPNFPMRHNKQVKWSIQLEPIVNYEDYIHNVTIEAITYENCDGNATSSVTAYINVDPRTDITITGKVLRNITQIVTKQQLYDNTQEVITHQYVIQNNGPSLRRTFLYEISFPSWVNIVKLPTSCKQHTQRPFVLDCSETEMAYMSQTVVELTMTLYLNSIANQLHEYGSYNLSTNFNFVYPSNNRTLSVHTTIQLLKQDLNLYVIIGSAVIGLLILILLVYLLYKTGFFTRKDLEKIRELKSEETCPLSETLSQQYDDISDND